MFLCLSTACAGGSAGPPPDPDAVVVAAFDFPESQLLAELYAQALESSGVPVRRELGLGTREFVQPALQQGLVDLVPEYGGSALTFVTLGAVEPTADAERTHRELADAFAGRGITVLAASLFEGGCVAYRYHFTGSTPPTLALEAEEALSFLPRSTIVEQVRHDYDQILCGSDAPPCEE